MDVEARGCSAESEDVCEVVSGDGGVGARRLEKSSSLAMSSSRD